MTPSAVTHARPILNPTSPPPAGSTGRGHPTRRLAVLVAVVALGWRAADPAEWPFPFHPTVQYESALAARAIWLTLDPAQFTPDRAAWLAETGFKHVVSPPLLPSLVAGVYCLAGQELPWVSKAFTALFWLAAGGLIGRAVARQTGSRWAALAAFGWFVLNPYGLMVSRSFQTESVLALGLAAAVWHLSRTGRQLRWRETIASGMVCGACAFLKPGVMLPPLAAGFAAVVLGLPGRPVRKVAHAALFAVLLALPSVVYVKLVLSGRGGELMPGLLLERWFYAGVATQVRIAIGVAPLVVGLAGVVVALRAGNRLPAGLVAGYLGYVGIFTYHCATHDYYHTPLLVLTAVGIGWAAAAAGRWIGPWVASRPRADLVLSVVAVLAVAGYLRATRLPFIGPWRYEPGIRRAMAEASAGHARRDEAYRAVAAVVGPGAKVVAVTEDYGYPLEYHAGLRVTAWPRAADAAVMVRAGMLPPDFTAAGEVARLAATGYTHAVVTDFAEWDRQPGLRAALAARGRLTLDRPDLLVFDLRGR